MKNLNMKNLKLIDVVSPFLIEAAEFDKTYFNIPIRECHEHLVNFENIAAMQDVEVIFNAISTSTGQQKLFMLREGLIGPVLSAIKDFNKLNLIPKIEYMYRRLEDQKAQYERSVRTWKDKLPNANNEDVLKIAGIFVASTPSTAGHLSGAAIDITLVDKNLKPIDMGVPYIYPGPESATRYPKISMEAKRNREILLDIMEQHGFANYPYEYWHFCMGDKISSRVQGKRFAKYGPVVYDSTNNKTMPVVNADIPFDVESILSKSHILSETEARKAAKLAKH
jgi:D-alanyl-D-alanine dipeptidase